MLLSSKAQARSAEMIFWTVPGSFHTNLGFGDKAVWGQGASLPLPAQQSFRAQPARFGNNLLRALPSGMATLLGMSGGACAGRVPKKQLDSHFGARLPATALSRLLHAIPHISAEYLPSFSDAN